MTNKSATLTTKKSQTVKTSPSLLKAYDSNPFTLAFYAFGRLFDRNLGWALAFLIIGFVVAIGQLGNGAEEMEKTDKAPDFDRTISHITSLPPEQLFGLAVVLIGVLLLVAIVMVSIFALQTFIGGIFAYVALHSEKDKKVPFKEAFDAAKRRFRRLFLAQGLAAIKIFLWTLLLIVPGIIAALRYFLLPYVIMDESEKEKGVKSSHTRVKALVKGRLVEVLGLLAAANIVPIIGGLLQLSGGAAQYHQLVASYHNGNPDRPPIDWSNYAAVAAWILLVITFTLLAFAVMILFSLIQL